MIKINLAGARAAAAAITMSEDVAFTPAELRKQGLLRLIAIIVFPLGLWAYEQSILPDLIAKRGQAQEELEKLKSYNARMEKSVKEIKKFKEDESKIQARIGYLDNLTKNKFREIKVIDLVQQVIPEKVWLTRLEAHDGKIVISGMAMTDFEISSFMESLAKSVHFVDVNLLNSNELQYDGLTIKRFEIACLMERPST